MTVDDDEKTREQQAVDDAWMLQEHSGVWHQLPGVRRSGFVRRVSTGAVAVLVALEESGGGVFEARTRDGAVQMRWVAGGSRRPGAYTGTRFDHVAVREQVAASGGEWVFARGLPRVYVYRIRRGELGYLPVGAYEAVRARGDDGEDLGLWIRKSGGGGDDVPA